MQAGVNQLRKLFIFIIVCMVICWAQTGRAFEPWNGATTANVNLRKSPGLDGTIIAGIEIGKVGLIKDKNGDWYQIMLAYDSYGYNGWIYGKYLKKVDNQDKRAPYPLKEAVILKPPAEESSLVVFFEEKGKKLEQVHESQENQPSSQGLSVVKSEKRKSPTANVTENFNPYKGLGSLTGICLTISSITLFCFTLVFFYRTTQLTKTNHDLSLQLQRIKGKFKAKKVSVKEKRQHARTIRLVEADFVIQDRAYKGFIFNISDGGAYIETRETFSVGQKLVLAFPSPNSKEHVKKTGEIVRIDKNGIGVKFEPKLSVSNSDRSI